MNKKTLLLGAGGMAALFGVVSLLSGEDEGSIVDEPYMAEEEVSSKTLVGTIPNIGDIMVVGPCYSGGLGNDTFPGSDMVPTDCYDLMSGGRDLLDARSSNERVFVRVSSGMDTIYLGAGDDVIEVRGEFDISLDAGAGENIIYLPGLGVPDVDLRVDGEDVVLEGKRGSIRMKRQYPREGEASTVEMIVFDNQTLNASEIYTRAIDGQATDGDDYLNGTPGDDVIYGGLGNDEISALAGDDTIFYEGGEDRVKGSLEGLGFDTLSLPFSTGEVFFRGVNNRDLVIETPIGNLTLEFQIFFPVGDERSNIERFIFEDGVYHDADIRGMMSGKAQD